MNHDKKTMATAGIYYEAMMLDRALSDYWQSEPKAPGTWQHNSFLEATLLHTRVMLDFFESVRTGKNPAHNDDVLAVDYGFTAPPFPFARDLRERINKRITHLSYPRTEVRDDDRYWDFRSFLPPILQCCRDFFGHLLTSGQPISDWPGEGTIKAFIKEPESSKGRTPMKSGSAKGKID